MFQFAPSKNCVFANLSVALLEVHDAAAAVRKHAPELPPDQRVHHATDRRDRVPDHRVRSLRIDRGEAVRDRDQRARPEHVHRVQPRGSALQTGRVVRRRTRFGLPQ